MFIRAAIAGLLVTVLLVTMIAGARLVETKMSEERIVMNDVGVIEITPPPPPPEFSEPEPEEPEPMEVEAAPSAPSLDVPLDTPAFDVPTINPSLNKVSLSTPMTVFHSSLAPSALPAPPKPMEKTTPTRKNITKPPIRNITRPARPVQKEVYKPSELDRKPTARRQGRFVWPSRARGRQGTVQLLIEINTSGRVRVVRVISSTDSALTAAAKKIATGSLYTVPTYRGKPVKTQFYKSYKLQKPR